MNNSHSKDAKSVGSSLPDVPVYALESLLRDCREAIIVHGAQRYRLRITASGKLILTK